MGEIILTYWREVERPKQPSSNQSGISAQYLPPHPAVSSLNPVSKPIIYINKTTALSAFAANYGSTIYNQNDHPDYLDFLNSRITPAEHLETGLNLIRYYENNNEPEKNWYDEVHNPAGFADDRTYWQFQPDEYAAMLSADYDGHGRSVGFVNPKLTVAADPTVAHHFLGIKNADPGAQVVFAGLADLRAGYVKEACKWFTTNRSQGQLGFQEYPGFKRYPFEVLNFHHYSTDRPIGGGIEQWIDELGQIDITPIAGQYQGISPEDDQLRLKITTLISSLDDIGDDPAAEPIDLLGTELWLSEFGYDTEPDPANASGVEVGDGTRSERHTRQAQWIVRSLLELSAAVVAVEGRVKGFDRAMVFDLRDEDRVDENFVTSRNYQTSGLMTRDYRPKRSYFHLLQVQRIMRGYRYDAKINPNDPDEIVDAILPLGGQSTDEPGGITNISHSGSNGEELRVYRYRNSEGKLLYAVWSPTPGAEVDVTFTFGGGQTITRMDLVDLGQLPKYQNLAIAGNSYTLSKVSETPVFFRLGDFEPDIFTQQPTTVSNVTATPACCAGVKLSWNTNGGGVDAADKTHIYFVPLSETTAPDFKFDFERATQVTNQASGTNYLATDLPTDLGPLLFFVIKENIYGQIASTEFTGSPSTAIWTASATPTNCSDCILSSSDYTLNFAMNSTGDGPPADYIALTETYLGANLAQPTCSDLSSCNVPDVPGDYTWDQAGDNLSFQESNTIEMIFNGPKFVNALTYLDDEGTGPVRIDYKDCVCDEWKTLTTLEMREGGVPPNAPNTTACDQNGVWKSVTNPRLGLKMYGLRIVRLTTDSKIKRLFICAEDASGNCTPGSGLTGNIPPPDAFTVTEVTSEGAVLEFDAVQVGENAAAGYYTAYTLKLYSDTGIESIPVLSDSWESRVRVELHDLQPGSEYAADVKVAGPEDAAAFPAGVLLPVTCFETEPSSTQRIPFTVPGGTTRRSKEKGNTAQRAAKFALFPNPTSGEISIVLPEPVEEITFYDSRGNIVLRIDGTAQTTVTVVVSNLPPGIYMVRTRRGEVVEQRRFIRA